ncbi:MAG: GNAT family N-acetyltransferase [Candidatus Eremiobacteraeota bacterium]|nr:GNAT family N-acetyltransferase [Candidatus Eremiobacteraeota bacterium]
MRIRLARAADIAAARLVITNSARELQLGDYTSAQIESALKTVYGVDSRLVADGTYFVAQAASGEDAIVGCGGWSKRRTLFGGDAWRDRDDDLLDPAVDAARIRALFVDPQWARKGVGSLILAECERAARQHGFMRFEAGATLTGVKFFAARGYVAVDRIDVPLEGGISIPVVRMVKSA